MSTNFKNFQNGIRLVPVSADPASPLAGDLQISDGTVRAKGLWEYRNSAWTQIGSSTSGINYITNSGFEETNGASPSGWSTYLDAAGTIPVDGTGGSPSSTFLVSTSSPLRGSGSAIWTKSANNRQGEGFSYAFTTDSADKAKILAITFDYTVVSGTYADNDMIVYLYDVTNSTLIEPTGKNILGGTAALSLKQISTFQTASNSTSYRLIVHTSSTSASAYTLKFDNISVGPQIVQYGAPITDWQTYTPIFSGITNSTPWTNSTVVGKWKRNGDSIDVEIGVQFTGTPGGGTGKFQWSLPAGLVIDTAKVNSRLHVTGSGVFKQDSTTNAATGLTPVITNTIDSLTANYIGVYYDSSTALLGATNLVTIASGDDIGFSVLNIPIVGWSSSVQMSNDTDTRVVSARYTGGTATVTSTPSIVKLQTLAHDTHGAYSPSTGLYTVPVSGLYDCYAQLYQTFASITTTQVGASVYVYKNGAQVARNFTEAQSTVNEDYITQIRTTISCVSGDTLAFYVESDATTPILQNSATNTWGGINRLTGPASIAASESVNAAYNGAPPTGTIAGSVNIVKYGTKVTDSHNAYVTSTGVYSVPVSGKYFVGAAFTLTCASTSSGMGTAIYVYQNGSAVLTRVTRDFANVLTSQSSQVSGIINCLAGDTIDIRSFTERTTPAYDSVAAENYVSIYRVGN